MSESLRRSRRFIEKALSSTSLENVSNNISLKNEFSEKLIKREKSVKNEKQFNLKFWSKIKIDDLCPFSHCWTFILNDKNKLLTDKNIDDYPSGSKDLYFIPNELLIKLIGIFDLCIRTRNILKLAPFRFEDLCVCLSRPGQSSLMAEIFMCLLKVLMTDDELQGISYFTSNERDFSFIFYHVIDKFTWIEAIKLYFLSNYELLLEYKTIINKPWFPIGTSIYDKVKLLEILCNRLLNTTIISDALSNGNIINIHDTNCKICGKNGQIMKCSTCPKVYHSTCLKIQIPDNKIFICKLCRENVILGLSEDLLTVYTNAIGTLRPIGIDNEGRLYWFTVRRLFVQDKYGKVLYYSSCIALKNLLVYLDKNGLNKQLVKNISQSQVIWNQINKNLLIIKSECIANYKSIYEIDVENVKDNELKNYYYIGMNGNYLRYNNYYSIEESSFWNYSQTKKSFSSSKINYYELKWRGNFFNLMKDVQDLEKIQGAPPRVIHEFAFLKLIQNTLINFESCLPSSYLHPIWYHQLPAWVKAVRLATSPAKLASLILLFCRMIKPYAFQNCWYESTGHSLPCKVIIPDSRYIKNQKLKMNPILVRNYQIPKIIKEYNEEGELLNIDVYLNDTNLSTISTISTLSSFKLKVNNRNNLTNNVVKNKNVPKHRIWEQKGEEYRITGESGWCLINKWKRTKFNVDKIDNENLKIGILDRLILKLEKENIKFEMTENYQVLNNNTDKVDNLPKLTPVKLLNMNDGENNYKMNDESVNYNYIPGESIQQFFKRKGSRLLCNIETNMNLENYFISNAEILLNRESIEFGKRRQKVINNDQILSVYCISNEERNKLARKGGIYEIGGFNYHFLTNRTQNSQNWPLCFPKPSISRIWENKMLNVNSLFDIAYLLKVLYSSLNIGQMNNVNQRDSNEIVVGVSGDLIHPIYCYQTNEGIVIEEIIDAIPISLDGLVYKYQIKKSIQALSKSLYSYGCSYGYSNNLLQSGNSFYLDKNGYLDIIPTSKNINQVDQNDGRYVSSFRKSLVSPNDLKNDHVLRSNSNSYINLLSKKKLPERIITNFWLNENDINTILVKRFWERIEQERTILQTEYTLQYKKWLKKSTQICDKNDDKNKQNNIEKNILESKELNYEDMLVYNTIQEDRLQVKYKMDLLLQFKIEKLLNIHAEYLKINLRRNKILQNLNDNIIEKLPYESYIDIKEKLKKQYIQEGFIISKNKELIVSNNILKSQIRKSKRNYKSTLYKDEYYKNTSLNIICCCNIESKIIEKNKDIISCNECQNLFHGICYGMTKLKSYLISKFYCPTCEFNKINNFNEYNKNEQSLDCICQNNNIDNLNIIFCLICNKYSHLNCLNLPINEIKCEEYFVCNNCQKLCKNDIKKLNCYKISVVGINVIKNLLKYLNKLKFATPFLYPVDTNIVKDYKNIIKKPMDLQTLLINIENNIYYNLENFTNDMLLIFNNCRLYNSKETFYVKYANLLECVFFFKLYYISKRSDIIIK